MNYPWQPVFGQGSKWYCIISNFNIDQARCGAKALASDRCVYKMWSLASGRDGQVGKRSSGIADHVLMGGFQHCLFSIRFENWLFCNHRPVLCLTLGQVNAWQSFQHRACSRLPSLFQAICSLGCLVWQWITTRYEGLLTWMPPL